MRLAARDFFPNAQQSLAVEPRCPQTVFPPHDHEFDEIVLVQSGNGWHIINDQPYFVTCGELFYIRSADHHEFDDVSELRLVNLLYAPERMMIRADALAALLSLDGAGAGRHWQVTEDTIAQLAPVIDALGRETAAGDTLSKAMAEALFLQLAATLSRRRFAVDDSDVPRQARLGHVLSYLRHNYAHAIDLDDLARRFAYSVRGFHRAFREATGTTPHTYITKLRITHAMRALISTEDSITRIALDCGFGDGNYFSYCFNKMTGGVAPSEYRRLARDGQTGRHLS